MSAPAEPVAADSADAGPSKNELKKKAKEAEKERKRIEREQREAEQKAAKDAADVDFATQNYGVLPLNQSQEKPGRKRTLVSSLAGGKLAGEHVLLRARVHNSRAQGAKMCFLELRQRDDTIQALMSVDADSVSKQMVKWATSLPRETIVLVEATVQAPKEPVKSTTVQDAELKIAKLHVISGVTLQEPFQLGDASRAEAEYEKTDVQYNRVALNTRLDARTFDLRTRTNQAIFRITSAVGQLFREYLDAQNFIEIHTPKLQGAATESGASVFKVDYFKRPAFLAQSPQLAKQMCIAGDMERVYEVGPVFRAEDSNTHRHMTEFTGLDLEMTIEEHYDEVIDMLDGLLRHVFTGLQTKFATEIEAVRKQFPSEPFTFPEKTVKLHFSDAVKLLREAGREVGDYEDFDSPTERFLGQLVKEKFGTDYYILNKFPLAVRPFYTMPDAADAKLSNSYDFFMRGEEILSGAQRVHTAKLLEENMRRVGIEPDSMKEYVDGFRWACPPHGGGGIGLERVCQFYLNLGNIRWASLFPRDPRSFPTGVSEASIVAPAAAATAP